MIKRSTIDLRHREEAVDRINEMRSRGLSTQNIILELNDKGFTYANRPITKAAICQLSAPHYFKKKDLLSCLESLSLLFNSIKPQPPQRSTGKVSLFFLSPEEIKVIKRWIKNEFGKIVSEASIKRLVKHHFQRELIQEIIIQERLGTGLKLNLSNPLKGRWIAVGQESSNSDTSKPNETKRMMILLTNKHRDWLRHKAYKEETQMSKIIRELLDNAIFEESN